MAQVGAGRQEPACLRACSPPLRSISLHAVGLVAGALRLAAVLVAGLLAVVAAGQLPALHLDKG